VDFGRKKEVRLVNALVMQWGTQALKETEIS